MRPILRRESGNRTKTYSKRKTTPAKSSNDVSKYSEEGNTNSMYVAKSVENLTNRKTSDEVLDEDPTEVNADPTTALSFGGHFEERAIDANLNDAEKAELQIPADILGCESSPMALKKLMQHRSKSVDSISSNFSKRPPSFNENIDFKLSRQDSLPPSYPSIFAERIRNGYHSETHLYLEEDETQQQQGQENRYVLRLISKNNNLKLVRR